MSRLHTCCSRRRNQHAVASVAGVYAEGADGRVRFLWVKAPTSAELIHLAHTLAQRIGRHLERQGLLERDADDCMDAGGRAPKVGAIGDARSSCREQLSVWGGCRSGADGSAIRPLDHVPHRRRSAGGAQGVRLKRLLLAPCRLCRPAVSRSMTRWARLLGSRCMPGWWPGPMNGRSWNACADTYHVRPYRNNGCH